ncbi:MAG: hypothetical protein FWE79_01565, partial [Firmicutes bacterium]|nr:hypothetical protein [Bacillota bacterium]
IGEETRRYKKDGECIESMVTFFIAKTDKEINLEERALEQDEKKKELKVVFMPKREIINYIKNFSAISPAHKERAEFTMERFERYFEEIEHGKNIELNNIRNTLLESRAN